MIRLAGPNPQLAPYEALAREIENMSTPTHEPVMAAEVLRSLNLKPGGVAVDGTLGLGGHARQMAEHISPGGTLIACDRDSSMLAEAKLRLEGVEGVTMHLLHQDFKDVAGSLRERGLRADGILLDLGLNSAQIDDPERGISFLHDGPLDMRMDRSQGESAAAWLNRATAVEIENTLFEFADERWSRKIASKIIERRATHPLSRTGDLVACVLEAVPPAARDKRIHPATRTFQAVRMRVNHELDGLEDALKNIAGILRPGGVLSVLSFHSGEDRIVKQTFRYLAQNDFLLLNKKPLIPTEEECRRNVRSRSAKLRSLQRRES
jgi:16S rRNA (cytosine1402-N4)-methyltransferase